MNRTGCFAVAACVIALALLPFPIAARGAGVGVGDTPELKFRSVDGKNVDLKDLKGKLVLVDFWATWCGPCMAEAGHMVETNKKYHDQGLQIIGISLDENRSALENVVKQKGFEWPQFFDGQGWHGKFAQAWGVNSIPRTFLIDPSGKVVWTGHPGNMDAPLEKAFKNTPPTLVDPAVAEQASAVLAQVEQSIAAGDGAGAIKQFAALPPDARKSGEIDARAKKDEEQLKTAADAMLAEVDPLIQQKQYAAAATKLKTLATALGDSDAATRAKKKLSELTAMPEAQQQMMAADKAAKADAELAIAQKLQQDGKDELAYARYRQIVKQFPQTEAATAAQQAVATYEKDPAFVQHATEATAGGKAKGALALAQSYRNSGRPDLAKKKYQDVIQEFPGTSYAETAARELAAMGQQ